jgi:hypothetical protein
MPHLNKRSGENGNKIRNRSSRFPHKKSPKKCTGNDYRKKIKDLKFIGRNNTQINKLMKYYLITKAAYKTRATNPEKFYTKIHFKNLKGGNIPLASTGVNRSVFFGFLRSPAVARRFALPP